MVSFDPALEGVYSGELTAHGPGFSVSRTLAATVAAPPGCLRRLSIHKRQVICP